ncbi:hypothetical protein [Pedobacter sp. GR22-10]|uniref:hypothetical protein n=1 Tax=Pedobacter sp. GR22-10 TaxID=2994472 RepID=UPI002245775A|nr:hypothetical protein [Pedobacter sp. GR22-10]MCX2429894.1 hypothetical protein [Pedobacter sp. GR22-10]
MSTHRLEAHYQDKTFFFKTVSINKDEVRIEMYGTIYILVKTGDQWQNHSSSRYELASGLIGAVLETLKVT